MFFVTVCAGFDAKDFAGQYDQVYSDGREDNTTVECNGKMTWAGGKLSGKLIPAGSKLPPHRADQNNDTHYQAADGWLFRPWDRAAAWEFVKFSNGQMIVHHFCSDSDLCNKTSPQGSGQYFSGSASERKPTYCAGTCQ